MKNLSDYGPYSDVQYIDHPIHSLVMEIQAESSSTFLEKFVGKRKETAEGPWIL